MRSHKSLGWYFKIVSAETRQYTPTYPTQENHEIHAHVQ